MFFSLSIVLKVERQLFSTKEYQQTVVYFGSLWGLRHSPIVDCMVENERSNDKLVDEVIIK